MHLRNGIHLGERRFRLSRSVTVSVAKVRYKFRYRHQVGLFTLNFPKVFSSSHLDVLRLFSITVIFHRLTVFFGNSKSVGGNSMGVRFPLPAPSILFIFSDLRGAAVNFSDTSGTKLGTVHILCIFNRLRISGTYPSPATLYIVSVVYA